MEKVNYEIERNRDDRTAKTPIAQESFSEPETVAGYLKDTVNWNMSNLVLIRNLFLIISGEEYIESREMQENINDVSQDSIYGLVNVVHSQSLLISEIVRCMKERIGQ